MADFDGDRNDELIVVRNKPLEPDGQTLKLKTEVSNLLTGDRTHKVVTRVTRIRVNLN